MLTIKQYLNCLKYSFLKAIMFICLACLITGCETGTDYDVYYNPSVIQGQVLNYSHPGPIPEGWTPPPMIEKCTVVVLNEQKNIIAESPAHRLGMFKIELSPGRYYLRVKESLALAETGPYDLTAGQTLTAEVHYDNGMR